jgi:hypothetical protein
VVKYFSFTICRLHSTRQHPRPVGLTKRPHTNLCNTIYIARQLRGINDPYALHVLRGDDNMCTTTR